MRFNHLSAAHPRRRGGLALTELVLTVEGAPVTWRPGAGRWEPVRSPPPGSPAHTQVTYALILLDALYGASWETGPWDQAPDRRRATEAVAYLMAQGVKACVAHVPGVPRGSPR